MTGYSHSILTGTIAVDWAHHTGQVIAGLLAALVTAWIYRKVLRPATIAVHGVKTLRYPKAFVAVCLVTFGFFLTGALVVAFPGDPFSGDPKREGLAPGFGVFAFLGAVGAFMCYRSKLAYDDEVIRWWPVWSPSFAFTWSDILQVKYSRSAQGWRLVLRKGHSVRVSPYMSGAVEFMRMLATRTSLQIPPVRIEQDLIVIHPYSSGD